ncbi:hypothetical protein [Deinococcus ruber]|uniref:hypothetical protein n=1 Tax=Deinococcus ruber TaxID=1848197 RepID=UPI00166F00B2|nr:hypothetical protein [Deinococcus ruber]
MKKLKNYSRRGSVLTVLVGASLAVYALDAAGAASVQYSGPIVISKGGVYHGNWQSLNANQPAVTITTSEPVTIINSNIQGRGDLIQSRYVRANLTVRNTRGFGLNPGMPASAKQTPGYFIHLEEFESANIQNNELTGTAGMYFRKFLGSTAKGQTIKILKNKALNIDGRYSDGENRFSQDGFYRVQFAQFNDIKNIGNAEIAWNQIINEPGKSRVEEVINMYVSSGLPWSYISIHDNYIQGAYPTRPASDSYGGGGIMLGDGHAETLSDASGYLAAFHNQVVATSNQGIAIAAGHDIQVYENRIISSGLLPDGTPIASQNVPGYVWDLHGDSRQGSRTFFNNFMRDNVVGWGLPLKSPSAKAALWLPDCQSRCQGNTILAGPITLATEAQEFVLWQQKLQAANVVLGPTDPVASR